MKNARKSSDPNSKAVKDFRSCLSIRMNIIRNRHGVSSSVPAANVIPNASSPSLLTSAPVTSSPISTPHPVLPPRNRLPNLSPTPATQPPVTPATPSASTPVSPLPTNVLMMRNALCGGRSSDNIITVGRFQTRSTSPCIRTPTSKAKASSAISTPVNKEKASRRRAYLRDQQTHSSPASQPYVASSSPSTPNSSSTNNRLFRACRLLSPSSA